MRRLIACLLLTCCAPAVQAWGALGHRLVGDLAQAELTPAAAREVARLLTGELEPTLAGVSTWADQLRDTDPVRFKATARWHFVNLAEHGCDYQPARDCKGGCVVAAIEDQTRLLADRKLPRQLRVDALKFVVHFIADIHQPLHGGYARDRGGNTWQVNYRARGDNLHSLWDNQLLENLDQRVYMRKLQSLSLVVPAPARVLPPDAAGWARESCAFVVAPGFYPASHVIDAAYIAASRPLAEERLRRAGARLAQVLNAAFGGR